MLPLLRLQCRRYPELSRASSWSSSALSACASFERHIRGIAQARALAGDGGVATRAGMGPWGAVLPYIGATVAGGCNSPPATEHPSQAAATGGVVEVVRVAGTGVAADVSAPVVVGTSGAVAAGPVRRRMSRAPSQPRNNASLSASAGSTSLSSTLSTSRPCFSSASRPSVAERRLL